MGKRTTKGTKQHYLPACVIGRFSEEAGVPTRERHVQAWRRGSDVSYRARANSLCAANGLYDGSVFDGGTIDQWDYEQSLTGLFDSMREGAIPDLDYYVHDLVPYVTALFMRGPDFDKRLMDRIASAGIQPTDINDDTVNFDRLFELQRLLPLLLASEWFCLHAPYGMNFILGDLGLCQTTIEGSSAWVVPVDPELALMVKPRKGGVIGDYDAHKHLWMSRVRHIQLHEAALERTNRNSMRQSQQLCMAKKTTDFPDTLPGRSQTDNLMAAKTATGISSALTMNERVEHEFEWYGLSRIAAEHMSPAQASNLVKNRPYSGTYPRHWKPQMPMISTNIMFFDSGVTVKRRELIIDLSETADFESHFNNEALGINMSQVQ